MGILSEDIFNCRKCGSIVVYEKYHTTGMEECNYCGAKHNIIVFETVVELIND